MTVVAVVGGGLTGLAVAHHLRSTAQVVVLEADERLGGKIRPHALQGVEVEAGPDCFLARLPWATDLCRAVGLGDDLVAPATDRAYVWSRGRLRALPDGLVLGVPTSLGAVARSGILSAAGLARAGFEPFAHAPPRGDDPSIAEAVGARFGAEVVDSLVEPLLGSINAGRADRLSLQATAPDLAEAFDAGGSVTHALRRRQTAGPPRAGPLFLTVAGGLQRLIDHLAIEVAEAGGTIRRKTEVTALLRTGDGRIHAGDVTADAVVLAVPAFVAADLVQHLSPTAARDLAAIDYASVVVSTLAYRRAAVPRPLDGSGFLVPRREGWLATACTWVSAKWGVTTEDGHVLLRCSAGRAGDGRALDLDDAELVRRLHGELVWAMGLTQPPVASAVARWPRAFPQYDVGHLARVDRIERALAEDAPGVVVAGAPYRGVGLSGCARQAREAALKVRATVSAG